MTSGIVYWLAFAALWWAGSVITRGWRLKRSWSYGLERLGAIYEKQGGGPWNR